MKGTLFVSEELLKAIDEIYRYPLRQSAIDTLNRQLRSGISNQQLSELVVAYGQMTVCALLAKKLKTRTSDYLFSRIIPVTYGFINSVHSKDF